MLGAVAFEDLPPAKETARKVLEEASEVREAWAVAEGEDRRGYEMELWLDECADLCQALVNLMASMGVTEREFAAAVDRCVRKNEERGRRYPPAERRERHVRCPVDALGNTIAIGATVTDGEKAFTVEAVGPEAVFGRCEEPAYAELYRTPAELEVCLPRRELGAVLADCDALGASGTARRLVNEAYRIGLGEGRHAGR